MRTRRSHRSHLQVFHIISLVHKLFNNLHTLQNLIFYPQHRKGYLKLKAMCMMVIVNKMVILYRYDIVNIDKIVNLNDHDSISIRYPRNRQENITETNVICMIQMIANALMIWYRYNIVDIDETDHPQQSGFTINMISTI